jgi:hypothetical protein
LPLQWREWAISLMRYGVRFIDIGHMGHSDATLLSHGDEDDRASEREILTSAPALSERGHRRLARGLVSVRRSAPLALPIGFFADLEPFDFGRLLDAAYDALRGLIGKSDAHQLRQLVGREAVRAHNCRVAAYRAAAGE